ncbi:MAG: hypothetical protein H7070_01815 [Saprospiraceae bacterium]|nr:hypothetical protein [Pyrinomonadaceae bacterium]
MKNRVMEANDDEFDDEQEARQRYPHLYKPDDPAPVEETFPPSGSNDRINDSINYAYAESLSADNLPDLDFYRFDNLFSAKTGTPGFFPPPKDTCRGRFSARFGTKAN